MEKKKILFLILILSAALRLYSLSSGDPVNDEVFMAFRGIGLMDFDEADTQTTPLEWWDTEIPWWTNLSFHDHPLLVPATQSLSIKIFGESNFGFRLPSALLGTASVYLIYLIGNLLYSKNTGLLAAALLGTTLNNIYISRVGMQEAYVIFFLLLASYFFLQSLRNDNYLKWAGAAIGLAALSKYTGLILVPIFLIYLLFFKREYFKNKNFWLGMLFTLLIFSPQIIYNIELYRATGHFDFQISYMIGQVPEYWQNAVGKNVGTLSERIQNFLPRLITTNSWLFLSLVAVSLIIFVISLLKNPKSATQKHSFLVMCLLFLVLLLLKIGPSYRFLAMLTPFFALATANFLENFHSHVLKNMRMKKIGYGVLILISGFEIFYSWNNQIAYYPLGPAPWLSSKVRFENYNWGYNELGGWLEKELAGKMPAITFDLKYEFLEKIRDQTIEKGLKRSLEPYPALFVYDGNFDKAAKLWVLGRLHIYHGWPIISLKTYYDYLKENGFDYYDRVGFKNHYFIFQNNIAPSSEAQILMRGEPQIIRNQRGDEIFKIYKF